jgi:hypothetical protein
MMPNSKQKKAPFGGFLWHCCGTFSSVVAGAGFEPATFGL